MPDLPPAVLRAMRRARREHLTYIPRDGLVDLATVVLDLEEQQTPGVLLEAGTALGGSALVLATAKARSRALFLHDVFGMIPPPSDRDGADVHARYERIKAGESKGLKGTQYYGYRDDLLGEVRASLAACGRIPERHSITLVPGLFQDTIETVGPPVALAHLDGDWYESTKVCLDRLAPRIVPGGRMVIDDYDFWSGSRDAVDEFLAGPAAAGFHTERRFRLHLVRAA